MKGQDEERRFFYRIRYPLGARPFLTLNGQDFPVIDVCEMGVRFFKGDAGDLSVGSILRFALTFANRATVELIGKIIRVEGQEAVVFLSTPIPPRRLLEEERYLVNRFPGYR